MAHLQPFMYTQLPPGHIRLLHVPSTKIRSNLIRLLHVSSTKTRSKLLKCKLQVFSLQERPAFEALSYAWGTEEASERIVCNGAALPVTPHLLEGLRSISEALSIQWLWIDAICINQFDDLEKASQVMQMWQIYSAASRAVVWMGPSDVTPDLISSVSAVSKDFAKVAQDELSDVEMNRILSPLAFRDDVRKLFISSWFERLWVVQEVVLAHSAIALYGTQVVELWSVLELGRRFNASAVQVQNPPNDLALVACSSLTFYKYSTKHKLISEGVTELLRSVRTKQTSERLDRVYAILGLLDGKIRDQVTIDYSQTSREEYWKAYICLCRLILQEYGESYLPYLSSTDRSTMMPSWCLNLDTEQSSVRLYNLRYGAGIASINTPCRGIEFSGGGLAICLEAFQVDVIEKMALSYPLSWSPHTFSDPQIEEHLSFLSSCNDLLVEMAPCEETTPQTSLAMVLVGGSRRESFIQQYPALEAEQDLRNCLEIWTDAQLNSTQKLNLLLRGRNHSYIDSSIYACIGRSLSFTMEGRWVLVPNDAKKSDVIVVIKGFKFPYVLRPVPDEDGQHSNTYNILGACYVDDIMDGEVHQSEAFKATGWTDIEIV